MLKVCQITKDGAYSRSGISLALKIRRKSSLLEQNRFVKAGPQTGRRKKQGPGWGTRWRAGPHHKKRGPIDTGRAPLRCTRQGPPELSLTPFPMRGPGCSEAGQGLNFTPLPHPEVNTIPSSHLLHPLSTAPPPLYHIPQVYGMGQFRQIHTPQPAYSPLRS